MKWLDIPPLWLLLFAVTAWLSRSVVMAGSPYLSALGTGLVAGGLVTIALAAWEMYRHRTTIVPHMQPDALVTTGPFAISRNPIYLADALILLGLSLRWDAPIGVLLVPAFVWLITRRFIQAEEARLSEHFGAAFDAYRRDTRRWL